MDGAATVFTTVRESPLRAVSLSTFAVAAFAAALLTTATPMGAATSIGQHQHAQGRARFGPVRLSGDFPIQQHRGSAAQLHLNFDSWGCCWPDDALLLVDVNSSWQIALDRIPDIEGWRNVGTCPFGGDNVPFLLFQRGGHRGYIDIPNGSCLVDLPVRSLRAGHYHVSIVMYLRHVAARDGIHLDVNKLKDVSPGDHLRPVRGARLTWQVTVTP